MKKTGPEGLVMQAMDDLIPHLEDVLDVGRTSAFPVFEKGKARSMPKSWKQQLDYEGFDLVDGKKVALECKAPGKIPKKRPEVNPLTKKTTQKNQRTRQAQWDRIQKIKAAGGYAFYFDNLRPVLQLASALRLKMARKKATLRKGGKYNG